MLVVIDNYDSFTYNLVQYFGELGEDMKVFRNDQTSIDELAALRPSRICISPGPCTPSEAGISNDVIATFAGKIPILGVCLGHQCIAQVFGGTVRRAARVMHGKTSEIKHDGRGVFAGLPNPLVATRYHSLLVEPSDVPDCLEVCAQCEDGDEFEIMGLRHRQHEVHGVQFHPESILTKSGMQLLSNFLQL